MISVQTFGHAELRSAAQALLHLVDESGFTPDLVIPIAKGGTYVAEAIRDDLAGRDIPTAPILCQRPGTQTKGNLRAKTWMTKLPLPVRNQLRIFEHYSRLVVDNFAADTERAITVEPSDQLVGRACERILIIDDATDSGHTLSAVRRVVQQQFSAADIRTGVLTQTRRHMAQVPDYCLFKGVLIRFHWSNDFRPNDTTSHRFMRATLGN